MTDRIHEISESDRCKALNLCDDICATLARIQQNFADAAQAMREAAEQLSLATKED